MRFDPKLLQFYGNAAIKAIVIFLSAKIIIWVLSRFVEKVIKLSPRFKKAGNKGETLSVVLKSAIKYTIYVVMVASILSVFNVLTQPVIAAAGVGGIAIGFGAQSLIKDFFTGFFILCEDQFSVGDYVDIAGRIGTVEDMSLRVTRLRAMSGELHIIPNGEIKTVTNHSRGSSLAVVEISISFDADRLTAMRLVEETSLSFFDKHRDTIEEKPEVLGVSRYGENEVAIKVIMKTKAMMHWQAERDLRAALLDAIKEAGIEPPIPRRIVYSNH